MERRTLHQLVRIGVLSAALIVPGASERVFAQPPPPTPSGSIYLPQVSYPEGEVLTEEQIIADSIIASSERLGKKIGTVNFESNLAELGPENKSAVMRTIAATYFANAEAYEKNYSEGGTYAWPGNNVSSLTVRVDHTILNPAYTSAKWTLNPLDGDAIDVTISINPAEVLENQYPYMAAHELGHVMYMHPKEDGDSWSNANQKVTREIVADWNGLNTLLWPEDVFPEEIRPDITQAQRNFAIDTMINTHGLSMPNSTNNSEPGTSPNESLRYFLSKLDSLPDDIKTAFVIDNLPYIFAGEVSQAQIRYLQDVLGGTFKQSLMDMLSSLMRFTAEQRGIVANPNAKNAITDKLNRLANDGFISKPGVKIADGKTYQITTITNGKSNSRAVVGQIACKNKPFGGIDSFTCAIPFSSTGQTGIEVGLNGKTLGPDNYDADYVSVENGTRPDALVITINGGLTAKDTDKLTVNLDTEIAIGDDQKPTSFTHHLTSMTRDVTNMDEDTELSAARLLSSGGFPNDTKTSSSPTIFKNPAPPLFDAEDIK